MFTWYIYFPGGIARVVSAKTFQSALGGITPDERENVICVRRSDFKPS